MSAAVLQLSYFSLSFSLSRDFTCGGKLVVQPAICQLTCDLVPVPVFDGLWKDTQWRSKGCVLAIRACSNDAAKLDEQSLHNTGEQQLLKVFDNLTILCKVSSGPYKRIHWHQSSCVGTRVPAGNSRFELADSTLHWFHIARAWRYIQKSLSWRLWLQVMNANE